jgi:hypothetical protein
VNGIRVLGIVLILAGIVLLVLGFMYFVIAADKLPNLLGPIVHATGHRTKRGVAGLGLGGICVIGGVVALYRGRR